MKSTTIFALMAATAAAVAIPISEPNTWTDTSSGLHVRGLGYRGDGLYRAAFDERGVAEVEFTPLQELNITSDAGRAAAPTSDDSDLQDRSLSGSIWGIETTCGDRNGNWEHMDDVNNRMANWADGTSMNIHDWVWLHHYEETSFLCNYQPNTPSRDSILKMHTYITEKCGNDGTKYGYTRVTNQADINDLSVGRTWRGNEICAKGFRPE